MADSEDIFGRMTGGLPGTGGQWPEARAFARTIHGNPFAQEALVKMLAGLWKNASEAWESNPNLGNSAIELEVVAKSVVNVIRYMRERFPEWSSTDEFVLDNDFGLPPYPGAEDFLKRYVEDVVLKGDFDSGGVE